MYRLLCFFFILGFITNMGFSQNLDKLARIQDSIYKENILKSRLYGVYIPKSIVNAIEELNRLSDEKSTLTFRNKEEKIASKKLYYGVGRWMSYNWNFGDGSRFSKVLNDLGLIYEDEMIDFMLRIYHRHLNEKELDINTLAKEYVIKREKKKKENRVVLQTMTIQRDSTYTPK